MFKLKSVGVTTLTLGCQLMLGAACTTATEEVSASNEAITDGDTLIAKTVCTGALEAGTQESFGDLQKFEFVRSVYENHQELSASLTLPGELGVVRDTASVGVDSDGAVAYGAVTITGSFGQYEVGSDHFAGLAQAFREHGTISDETIRIAYWSPQTRRQYGPPFVIAFEGGKVCQHTVE